MLNIFKRLKRKFTNSSQKNSQKSKSRNNSVLEFADIMDISYEAAERIMKAAKSKYGLKYKDFLKYEFYKVDDSEKESRAEEILREKQERKERIRARKERIATKVSTYSGWSYDEAYEKMEIARKELGISNTNYLRYRLYLIPECDQKAEYLRRAEQTKAKIEQERRECIRTIVKESGCTEEKAAELFDEAHARMQITAKTYRRYRFWEIPIENQEARLEEIRDALTARAENQNEDYTKYLQKIMNVSGMGKDEALEMINEAFLDCGASRKDFYAFQFWEIDKSEWSDYFTTQTSLALSQKYDVLANRDFFVNKEMFLEKFAQYIGRPWCISTKVSYEEFVELFDREEKVLYKPSNNGNSGSGIEIFTMEDIEYTYEQIAELPRGIVEGYVKQHPQVSKMYPNAVDTLRIASLCYDDEVTGEEKMDILYGVFRIGSGGAQVDNFTTGGIVAALDLETGCVATDGVTVDGIPIKKHPDTGVEFKGFEIPYFKEAIELVREAGKGIHNYIGWDVAITENGPILIEANIDPGNRLLQMPYVAERKGMAYIIKKYL